MSIKMKFYACFVLVMVGVVTTLLARDVLDVKREIIVKFDDTVIVMQPEIQSSGKEAIAMCNDPCGDLFSAA